MILQAKEISVVMRYTGFGLELGVGVVKFRVINPKLKQRNRRIIKTLLLFGCTCTPNHFEP